VQKVDCPLGTVTGRGGGTLGRESRGKRADQGALGRRPRHVPPGHRRGIAEILASYGDGGLEVVAEILNGEEAMRLARELDPDVVVMQVQMPLERSLETRGTLRSFPAPKVVICTMIEKTRYVGALAGAGARA
jgi:DNA-binding NarL/FixJ family response regulator